MNDKGNSNLKIDDFFEIISKFKKLNEEQDYIFIDNLLDNDIIWNELIKENSRNKQTQDKIKDVKYNKLV